MLSFYFRDLEQTGIHAMDYFEMSKDLTSWSVIYVHTSQAFFGGLAAFWIYRKTNDPIWLQRGKKAKITMEKWTQSSEWNFQSRFYLLEAEAYFCNKDYNSARASYDRAIESAKKHR